MKELGYAKDIHGKNLENVDQVLELKPHDVILPSPTDMGKSQYHVSV